MKRLRLIWIVFSAAAVIVAVAWPAVGTGAQDGGDEATVRALQTEVATLKAEVALQTEVAGGATSAPVATIGTAAAVGTAEAEKILYRADWSDGLGEWIAPPDWDVADEMLVNDGTNNDSSAWAVAPFAPGGLSDYAVEAEIQRVDDARLLTPTSFGIVVRAGADGAYWIGPSAYRGMGASVDIRAGQSRLLRLGVLAHLPFEPGADWHTYRAEVRGDVIRLLIDGRVLLETTDDRFPLGGQVGLWSNRTSLTVRSFEVVTLTDP